MIASDRLGNPVPDNTAINFVTEGGQIQGGTNGQGTCATTAGTCSVTLKSANSRPTDGRVTVLAYALGEKSFVDLNTNNTWDASETFHDLGDPFIDANENGSWDSGEQSWSYASGSTACGSHANGGAVASAYPSSYDDAPSKAGTCSGSMSGTDVRAYVRRLGVITFSGSAAFASTQVFSMNSTCRQTFGLWIMDANNNPMPKASALTTGNNDVTYRAKSSGDLTNATITVNDSAVLDSQHLGGTFHTFTVDGGNTDCPGLAGKLYPAGTFDLIVTTPKGNRTAIPITVN